MNKILLTTIGVLHAESERQKVRFAWSMNMEA